MVICVTLCLGASLETVSSRNKNRGKVKALMNCKSVQTADERRLMVSRFMSS